MMEIKLKDLSKVYTSGSEETVAVDSVDMTIEDGEFFTLVGPSGCGKTTTLRMIAGLETPASGHIYFGDEEVTDTLTQERNIAMVFQNVALYPHMTNYENIGFPLKVKGNTDDYDRKIREVAEMLGIADHLDKQPDQISGGQQQRVALGRAIIQDTNVILLDEPFSDLDAKLKAELRVELQRIHDEIDTTMVYVTHDQEEAMTMSDRIGLMNNGQFAQIDTPAGLFNSPVNEFVARFLGQPSMNIVDATLDGSRTLLNGTDRGLDLSGLGADDLDRLQETADRHGHVRLGFRPRHVDLTDDAANSLLPLDVEVQEPIGTDYIFHMTTADGDEITAVVDQHEAAEVDDTVGLGGLDTVYFFDPGTREQLLRLETHRSADEARP